MSGDPVVVELKDDQWVCKYGTLTDPELKLHHHVGGPGRVCIHASTELPPVMLFGRDHILSINWQPTVYTGTHWPAIFSRIGDLVTLAVDHLGDTKACPGPRKQLGQARKWVYRLMPVQWWDEDKPAANVLLGIWTD